MGVAIFNTYLVLLFLLVHFKVAHVIRKVLLRQLAIINYINPF
jgi:hypothetical protein